MIPERPMIVDAVIRHDGNAKPDKTLFGHMIGHQKILGSEAEISAAWIFPVFERFSNNYSRTVEASFIQFQLSDSFRLSVIRPVCVPLWIGWQGHAFEPADLPSSLQYRITEEYQFFGSQTSSSSQTNRSVSARWMARSLAGPSGLDVSMTMLCTGIPEASIIR